MYLEHMRGLWRPCNGEWGTSHNSRDVTASCCCSPRREQKCSSLKDTFLHCCRSL